MKIRDRVLKDKTRRRAAMEERVRQAFVLDGEMATALIESHHDVLAELELIRMLIGFERPEDVSSMPQQTRSDLCHMLISWMNWRGLKARVFSRFMMCSRLLEDD